MVWESSGEWPAAHAAAATWEAEEAPGSQLGLASIQMLQPDRRALSFCSPPPLCNSFKQNKSFIEKKEEENQYEITGWIIEQNLYWASIKALCKTNLLSFFSSQSFYP